MCLSQWTWGVSISVNTSISGVANPYLEKWRGGSGHHKNLADLGCDPMLILHYPISKFTPKRSPISPSAQSHLISPDDPFNLLGVVVFTV